MLSFSLITEDLLNTEMVPTVGGVTPHYSLINMEKPGVELNTYTTTNGMDTWNGIKDRAVMYSPWGKHDYAFQDNFGNQMVKTSAGQIIPRAQYDQIYNGSGDRLNTQNAFGNLQNKTGGFGKQLGYGINRVTNWVGHNPIPTAAIAAGGIYLAAQNRDRFKNLVPGRSQPVGY